MIKAWRIVQRRWQDTALSGEGARLCDGRWHSKGIAIVYSADSLALALLEILVHTQKSHLLSQWVTCPLDIPDEIVAAVDMSRLPPDWANPDAPDETRQIGNRWAREKTSAVLRVPSAVSRVEFNFLLNPLHPDFCKIKIGPFRPFTFDSRLAK